VIDDDDQAALGTKGKAVDFKQLLRMELDGGTTNIQASSLPDTNKLYIVPHFTSRPLKMSR
jgi:hypothetical protein